MRRLFFSCVLAVFISTAANAQPFGIGDEIPQNTPIGDKTLADYKGKLVIFDLWATWSYASISQCMRLDSLQRMYGNQVAIILVNSVETGDRDDIKRVREFYENWKRKTSLEMVKNDSVITFLFPHATLPYCVWIAPDGKVIATTDARHITSGNIDIALITGSLSLSPKEL